MYYGRETIEAFRAWRVSEIEAFRDDLELVGLQIDATTAASRVGCRRSLALMVLVELHQAAGHSQRETAEILGVSMRSVQRYQSSLLRAMPWVPGLPIRTFDSPTPTALGSSSGSCRVVDSHEPEGPTLTNGETR